jgi:hypothetical protein
MNDNNKKQSTIDDKKLNFGIKLLFKLENNFLSRD